MLKNGIYNVLFASLRATTLLLTIPITIRGLGSEEYGLLTLASTIILVVCLAESGISSSITVFIAKDLESSDRRDIVENNIAQTLTIILAGMILISLASIIFLVIGSPIVSSLFIYLSPIQKATLTHALQISSLFIIFRFIQQTFIGLSQAYQYYGWINGINSLQALVSALGIWVIVSYGGKTLELVKWQVLSSMVGLLGHLALAVFILRDFRKAPAWNKKKAKQILGHSISIWLGSIGGILFTQCDRLIIGSVLGTQALGNYAVATGIASQLNLFSSLIIQPISPILTSITSEKNINYESISIKMRKAVFINSLFSLGFGGLIITLSPIILTFLLGRQFELKDCAWFNIIVTIYSIYSTAAPGYYVLNSTFNSQKSAVIQLLSGMLSLVLITFGVFSIGILGAAIGNIGYLGVLYMNYLGSYYLKIPNLAWMKWIGKILIYFVAVVSLRYSMEDSFSTTLELIAAQLIILVLIVRSERKFYIH